LRKRVLPHDEAHADACHLCSAARYILRDKYPENQGVSGGQIVKEKIAEAYFLAAKKEDNWQ